MTIANDAMVPWIAAAAVIGFLSVCVWHNRRTGYQSEPVEKIPLGEAIALIKQSLTLSEDGLPGQLAGAWVTSTQTDQLISLNSALQNRRQVAPYQTNEIEAPVYAESNIEEPIVRS